MPFSFPASPTVGDLSTQNSRQFRWTGYAWELVASTDDARWDYFKPAAPTGVTATAGNAQAVVSWTAPAIVVPPVTDYAVQLSTDGGSNWTPASDAVSTATSATITGLTNGTAYRFKVAGINGIGTGPYSAASSAVTPVAGDPLFGNVALLLHMDGTGSSFVDSSSTPKTITAVGATQSTAQSQWGGKSAFFNGTDHYLEIPGVNIGTGDFAIEMWFKTNSNVAYAQLIGNETAGSASGFSLLINNDSSTGGQIALYRGGMILSSSSGDFSDDQWHYLALSRSGTTVRLYIDGAIASTATSSANLTSAASMYVGYNNAFPPRNVVGYIDDLRITVGSARNYTGSTITVPLAAFPDLGPPAAPTSLTASRGNTQISLAWTAPSSNGGSAITGYTVEYTPSGGSAQTVSTGSTSTSYTLTGLTNGTAYTVRVAAANVAGAGDFTAASSSVTPGPFTPADLAGLAVWLDASEASSLYNATSGGSLVGSGGTVNRWQDLSGNGRHVVGDGGPVRSVAAVNGRDALSFSSSLLTNTGINVSGGNQSLFMVVRFATSGFQIAGGFGTGGSFGALLIESNRSSGSHSATFGGGGSEVQASGGSSSNVTKAFGAVLGSGTGSLLINGTSAGTVSRSTVSSSSGLSIGSYYGAVPLSGLICEVVYLARTVTAGEISDLQTYFAAKWGV